MSWRTHVTLACLPSAPNLLQMPDHPWASQHRTVDVTDLLGLLGQYGSDGTYDTDGNGTVDVTDLLALLGEYGTDGCSSGGGGILESYSIIIYLVTVLPLIDPLNFVRLL